MTSNATTKVFDKIVEADYARPRYVCNEGGARSSKTYSLLQFLILRAQYDRRPTITSVVSETLPHLKRGAIRDFCDIMRAAGAWQDGRWSKVEHIYTFANGSIIEFFSADQTGKVLGPKRDRLFVNEANHIDWETFRQLDIRTRERVYIDYNPEAAFWAHEKLIPFDDCLLIHSTYKDNPFLAPEQVAAIERNRDDKRWWRVYGEGLVGQYAGTVYDFELIDDMPGEGGLVEVYGMDFGYTHDPTAAVRILADTGRKVVYADEVVYETGLLNRDIVARLDSAAVPKRSVPIYADCAEPKSIAEIFEAGYNVKPCDKAGAKLVNQIQWMQGWRLKVTKRSLNMIRELRNYVYMRDKDGNELNTPVDKWNHALDALRYGCYTHLAKNAGSGHYCLGFH